MMGPARVPTAHCHLALTACNWAFGFCSWTASGIGRRPPTLCHADARWPGAVRRWRHSPCAGVSLLHHHWRRVGRLVGKIRPAASVAIGNDGGV